MGNQFVPDGLVLNKYTISSAFKLTGQSRYAEYVFPDVFCGEIGCQPGTILAVRRVQKQDKTEGFFKVVGCFHRDNVPDEESARRIGGGNTLGRASLRNDAAFALPPHVQTDLKTYAANAEKKKRKYFVRPSDYPPTPQPAQQVTPPFNRPNSADSSNQTPK
jgi:hypothetical protein